MKSNINFNIIISFLLIFLVAIFNKYSWLLFFDSDGYLKPEKAFLFFFIDILFLSTAVLFYINRNKCFFIFSFLKILIINSIILFILLLILELFFGNWFNNNNINQLNIKKNFIKQYSVQSLYPWHNDKIIYTRDRLGFRGEYSALDSIDILTIGGSTTDQRYISDGFTFQDILKQHFLNNGKNISIVNSGIDGQSTYGHIKNFDLWFSRIPDLKSKYILFYIGVNDFYKDSDYYYDNLPVDTVYNFIKEFKANSPLYYLYRTFRGIYFAKVFSLDHNYSGNKEFSTENWTEKPISSNYKSIMKSRLDAYEQRLNILCDKVKSMGGKPIFVTQSARRLYDIIDGKIIGDNKIYADYDGHLINGVDYYYMIRLLHESTKKVCIKNDGIFIDLDQELQFSLYHDFYDVCHNTPLGAEKIGKYLYKKLKYLFY